jgi:type IV pilus assembly protein PilA
MLNKLRTRLQNEDEGFTLIELMVVVLIIAILIAIAIPTFLGAQDRARDRGAQSDLRNAITAAKTIATDDAGKFTSVDVDSLKSAEGALSFGATGTSDTVGVVVATGTDPQTALVYKESASGTWFGMATDSDGGVVKCKGAEAEVNTYAACDGAAGADNDNW